MVTTNEPMVMSDDFIQCWNAAGAHIQRQAKEGELVWMRAHTNPPFMEHFSFRLGNQLFFVRIEDADSQVAMPGTKDDLIKIATECKGHACIMRMRFGFGSWICADKGWGLTSAVDGQPINPPDLVTDEKIEMTDWELHDFAVQMAVQQLMQEGVTVSAWNSIPDLQPCVWTTAPDGTPQWVVIQAVRYPNEAQIPANIHDIERQYAAKHATGNFAYVIFSNAAQPIEKKLEPGEKVLPIYRGEKAYMYFSGLTDINE